MAHIAQLKEQLDRLAQFDRSPFPVVSLYLNLQPNQNGRDAFEPFLRKELGDRVRTYAATDPEHESLETDAEKIRRYVADADRSLNGLAIFACSAADLFETVPLSAPIDEHRLYISDEPHLYPLARLIDEYPQYAVLLADTHSARIFVFAANTVQQAERVEGTKTKRHKMGGWSQARYQRHVENYHLHHAKEVVDTLARIVRDEGIGSMIIAGDEAIVPLLKEHLPKDLTERVVDYLKLEMRASERDILDATIAAMREKDAATDRERVDALIGAYRGNGLAVVGVDLTRKALELGQVDELVISGVAETIDAGTNNQASGGPGERSTQERVADELIAKTRQTAAKIRFIEDPTLLEAVGGVGAFLRFRL